MRSNQSPRAAKWLLQHFGCSPNNEAIVGDLDERYHRHQSHLWYWKQVLVTVVVGFFQDLRHHKFLAVRVVILNSIFIQVVANSMFNVFGQKVAGTVRAMADMGSGPPFWIFAIFSTVVCIVGIGMGFISRCLSRRQKRVMVLLCAWSVLLYLVGFAIASGVGMSPLSAGGSASIYWMNSVILVLGIFLGGGIFTSTTHNPPLVE